MSGTTGMKSLEKWVWDRYKVILKNLKGKEFYSKDVEELLEENDLKLSNVNELLNTLEEDGLVEEVRTGKYNRKFYEVRELDVQPGTTKDEIIRILKMGADLIRGRVNYRVLLILTFYKALSDHWNAKAKEYLRETGDEKSAYHLANVSYYRLYDEGKDKLYTWDAVTEDKLNMMQNFINGLNRVAELNDRLSDIKILVNKLGLTSFVDQEDNYQTFVDLIDLFDKINVEHADYDVLGSAYEWILSYFAQSIAKAGEIFTPREVIRMMIRALDVEPDSDVLDPASGSGAMLIETHNYVSRNYDDGKTLRLEGQEFNDVSCILSKINLLMHGIENYKINRGDSLMSPHFEEADYIITNPPWNLKGYGKNKVDVEGLKKIYKWGYTTKSSADWLWIQMSLQHTKEKAAIIMDNGALFRSGREKRIRKGIIHDDLLECVMLLPEKLFYNTGAPGAVLIFNKDKPEDRKGKVLFINASDEYEDHPNVRKLNLLAEENIQKIVDTYQNFTEEEGFSKVVPHERLKEHDYNLNVSLYAYPPIEREDIDVRKDWKKLSKIEVELSKIEKQIEEFLEEVGI